MSQKNKKRGKNTKSKSEKQKQELIFAESDQVYGIAEKMLGNCRIMAKCSDGINRICHIRGKMKKRSWIREDSIILINLRQFENDKADIVHCYAPEEVRRLRAYGELSFFDEKDEQKEHDTIFWDNDDKNSDNDDKNNGDIDNL